MRVGTSTGEAQSHRIRPLPWWLALVADAAALDALAARLNARGVKVRRAPHALADERHVTDLVVFQDPAGNRLEVFPRTCSIGQ